MARLQLTLACDNYDRTRALWDGSIQIEGIDLNFVRMEPGETFWRQLRYEEFDASEMSTSALIALAGGEDVSPYVAIPAFTSRTFRHDCIFVRSDGSITRPEQLAGRRVGVPQYHMTAALWIRGLLQHDFGVAASDVEWIQGGLDAPGYPERVGLRLPPEIRVAHRGDQSLSDLLLEGELDAIIGAEWPALAVHGDPRISHLLPDYQERARDYYRRTGFFPIMHCVAIRRAVYERNPWIAQSLLDAFTRARDAAYAVYDYGWPGPLKFMDPWFVKGYRDTIALMGKDYWRYGFEASRHELAAMCQYALEQGLTSRLVRPEEVFARETLAPFPLTRR